MKLAPIAIAAAAAGLIAIAARAEQPLPTPFPEARYKEMSARSPFAVASATESAAAPTPGFAAQLYVDAVATIGTNDFVAIKSRDPDKPAVIWVQVGDTTDDGMKVDRLQWSEVMGKSTVQVSKSGEKATLIFDEQQMAKTDAPQPAPPGAPGIRLPMIPGRPMPMQNPQLLQQQQLQRARLFPQPQPNANPALPPGVPGVDVRRRVRVIQTGQ